jgi:hypothetical protein
MIPAVPQPEFEITLRALPSSIPPAIRLRRFLKMAKRCYRLECVELRETKPAKLKGTPNDAEDCPA